jgi:hypothetical protein
MASFIIFYSKQFLGQPSVLDSDLRRLNGCIRFFVRTLNGHAHKTQSGPRLAREDKLDLQKKGRRARRKAEQKYKIYLYGMNIFCLFLVPDNYDLGRTVCCRR